MGTLVAGSQLLGFINYLDAFTVDSFYQYSRQIEADLSGNFTYKKISTAQMAVGSTGDIVVVNGSGLSIPVNSLLNGSDGNLSWSNVGGTVQELQIWQGGSFSGSAVSGGTELLDAMVSSSQYVLTYGADQLIVNGSGLPTSVAALGGLIHGGYSGGNVGVSSITLKEGQESATLSLSSSAYTITAGDYQAVLSGSNLPTSFSPAYLEALFTGNIGAIGGSINSLSVSQISTGATILSESGITGGLTMAQFFSGQFLADVGAVQAPASVIGAELDRLDSAVAAGTVTAIQPTDSGTPTLDVTGRQLTDTHALALLKGGYNLAVNALSSYEIERTLLNSHVTSIAVADYGISLGYNWSSLEDAQSSGRLTGVALLDSGVPNIEISTGELAADQSILKMIQSDFTVTADSYGSSVTAKGYAGHGNILNLGNFVGAVTVTPAGDGVSFTVTTTYAGTDHLSNFNGLEIAGQTYIVAATPGSGTVTAGNITELYGAVFGRVPDVAGLAYYQGVLQANPSTPLLTFAQWFLASPEYTNNSAHNYAQNSVGDAQFITDSYNNLLHRAPAAGDVAWYQANVIAPILGSAASGTAAYATAESLAHATLLVDFSASSEFLNDVQVTAQHSFSSQHWLFLI